MNPRIWIVGIFQCIIITASIAGMRVLFYKGKKVLTPGKERFS